MLSKLFLYFKDGEDPGLFPQCELEAEHCISRLDTQGTNGAESSSSDPALHSRGLPLLGLLDCLRSCLGRWEKQHREAEKTLDAFLRCLASCDDCGRYVFAGVFAPAHPRQRGLSRYFPYNLYNPGVIHLHI